MILRSGTLTLWHIDIYCVMETSEILHWMQIEVSNLDTIPVDSGLSEDEEWLPACE